MQKVDIRKINKKPDNIKHLKFTLNKLLSKYKLYDEVNGLSLLLKPNMVAGIEYTKGAVTNPYLVRALVEILMEYKPNRIIIADGAAVGNDTEEVFRKTGYTKIFSDLIKKNEVDIVDFKKENFKIKKIEKGRAFKELKIPEILDEIDLVINVPVMKTHDALPVTLGIKNMKGIIHESDKKKFHKKDLCQSIIDLHKLITPGLTIYDGTIAMEGLGPAHGDPVNFGLIMAAEDVVAGDMVGAYVMGFDKEELILINLAEKEGLGTASLEEIEVIGEKLSDVRQKFSRYEVDKSFYEEHNIKIKDNGGCSGCRHDFDCIIKDFDEKTFEFLKNKTIYLGPAEKIDTKKDNTILIGSCLKNKIDEGYFLEGCPPHINELKPFLRSKGSIDRIE